MKIYNTLSRTKEEFVPIEPGKVRMYVCGPTVYNLIHIGNARPMIFFDSVRRYLEYKGYEVNYVSNFTDVDDKIIKAANAEGVDSSVISERYIEECKKDMAGMDVRPATTHPKATEEIGGMIKMIRQLIAEGHAYEVNGTVYFRVRSFKEYGKLSGKNLDELESGSRTLLVTGEDEKEDPLDFALWKARKTEDEKRGRTFLAEPLGRRTSGLAHRMLGHVEEVSRRGDRHPRRRRRSDLPAPRKRDRPERSLQRPRLCPLLDAQRLPEHQQREDVEIPRQFPAG